MIYIKTDIDGYITYMHKYPFDEVIGMGLPEEELLKTGYLVNEVPEVSYNEKREQKVRYNKELGVLEVVVLDTLVNITADDIEDITKIKNKLKSKTEVFEESKNLEISFEDFKLLKKESLKEQCTNAIYASFTSEILGKTFGFNEHDQSNFTQQLLLIVAAGGNYPHLIEWKSLDGSVNELTVEQFNSLIQEATTHKISQQRKYWELEKVLNEATTKEEIIAIEW